MKNTLTLLLLIAASLTFAKPQVYFNYKIFHTPANESYISTTLQFISGSFKFVGVGNSNLNAKVEITHIFSQNDKIILADKYLLDSPIMEDSVVEDFYDVQRYSLVAGTYDYELVITDVFTGETVSGKQVVEIEALNPKSLAVSDLEFIEDAYPSTEVSNFTKSGYFLIPYLTNYFPPEIDKIAFYYEVYNSQEIIGVGEEFIVTCGIENYETGRTIENIFKFSRLKTAPVCSSISVVPIQELPSGDYNLVLNVINKNNDTLLTKEVFFQRRNDRMQEELVSVEGIELDPTFRNSIDYDSLPYFLGSIMPISERYEYETIRKMLKMRDTVMMEKYFFAFWKETNPESPFTEWLSYKKQVKYTEQLFGTQIKYGWETDRGRIHLKYGSPNQMVDRPNEPSAYPYQIWHYYRIGPRSNVRFVFYNPDLITNDYPLLHSDMQGELQNYRWEADLHKRDTPNTDVDNSGGSVHYGGNAGTLFRE